MGSLALHPVRAGPALCLLSFTFYLSTFQFPCLWNGNKSLADLESWDIWQGQGLAHHPPLSVVIGVAILTLSWWAAWRVGSRDWKGGPRATAQEFWVLLDWFASQGQARLAERSRSRGHGATSMKSHFMLSLEDVLSSDFTLWPRPWQATQEGLATAASQSCSQLTEKKKLQHWWAAINLTNTGWCPLATGLAVWATQGLTYCLWLRIWLPRVH